MDGDAFIEPGIQEGRHLVSAVPHRERRGQMLEQHRPLRLPDMVSKTHMEE